MMMTKLHNKGHLSKFQRKEIAKKALSDSEKPKQQITLFQARTFQTFVQASYFENGLEKSAMIKLDKLEEFVIECAKTLPQADIIDLNAAIYLEENMHFVCAAYLEAGKELMV